MKPRKPQSKKATNLPQDFLRAVSELFNNQFKKERDGAEFLIYGAMYMNEVVLCVSLTHPKTLNAGTMFTSMDLQKGVAENPDQVTEKLKSMVDISASWFGQCFVDSKEKGVLAILEAIRDQPDLWQEVTWEKEKLFVRLNRENRALENAADRFLQEKGFDPNEEELTEAELEAALDDDSEGEGFGGPGNGSGHLH